MMNKKFVFRLAALLAALSLFAVLTFEVLHAGHEENCHEENCAICLVLQVIHNTKKISVTASLASIDFSAFNYINLFIIHHHFPSCLRSLCRVRKKLF